MGKALQDGRAGKKEESIYCLFDGSMSFQVKA